MKNEAQTAKARAESKFKMVGTKLNEDNLANFEELMKKRGFKTSSSYIKHLIDFDAVDSIEEERKQNEIMTNTIEVMRVRIEELEGYKEQYKLIKETHHYMQYIATKIKKQELEDKEQEKEPKKGFFDRLKGIFK